MGVRSSSTRRTSAASAISGQIVAINTAAGGVSVAGGRITATTPVSLGVVTAGQSSAATVVAAAPNPVITSLLVTDSSFNILDDTAFAPEGGYAKVIGKNFKTGAVAYINGVALVTTFISTTELNLTVPASATGSYSLMVFNPDNTGAIYLGLGISNLPTFTTPADSLAAFYETQPITASVNASGDNPITYTIYSGSLPAGAALAADGTITGTSPVAASTTVYTFVIKASDAQNQDSFRSFSLTINPDLVSWVSPNTIIDIDGTDIGSIPVSATAATGNTVSYTVDSLPNGLSYSNGSITGAATVEGTTTSTLTATSAITNRSAVRYVTWTVSLGDIYWKNTTLLLNAENNVLPFNHDASLNSGQLSIFGDTKPNNFSPYEHGYYSNYFDGTGDKLSIATNSAFTFGTDDFTIECWFNTSSATVSIFDLRNTIVQVTPYLYASASTLRYYVSGADRITSTALSLNTWYHLALVRVSGVTKMYLNGQQAGSSYTDTNNYISNAVNIGGAYAAAQQHTGLISNLRVVKGVGVYTDAFTPPTSPLTITQSAGTNIAAITGTSTSLLTCQANRLIDSSVNNFAITKAGDTKVSSAQPFVTPTTAAYDTKYSTTFDGTGDYLTVPSNAAFGFGTGDFTVECWVYPTVNVRQDWIDFSNGSQRALLYYNGSAIVFYSVPPTSAVITGPAMTLNAWTHLAVSKQSGLTKLFVNGNQVGSTYSTNQNYGSATVLTIGKDPEGSTYVTGRMSNVRIVKGTALYTENFEPATSPLTAVLGTSLLTCQDAILKDNSTNNFTITSAGQAQPVAVSPFTQTTSSTTVASLGSAYFDGTGDYISIPASPAFTFTGDFTIDGWVYPTALGADNCIIAQWTTSLSFIVKVVTGNRLYFAAYPGSIVTQATSTVVPLNQWSYIAIIRTGTTIKLFVNGVQDTTTGTVSGSLAPSTTLVTIGALDNVPSQLWAGYISDLRVIKGTALYTANFLPPQAPVAPVANTQLLTLQTNGGANNNGFVDQSNLNNPIARTGNVTQGTFSPFSQNGWSNYFNRSKLSSVLTNKSPGTNSFTYELFFNVAVKDAAIANVAALFSTRGGGTGANGFDVEITTAGEVLIGTSGAALFTSSTGLVNNGVWYHLAIVRNGNTNWTIYLNGTSIGTISNSTNFTSTDLYLGVFGGADNDWFKGYISNFRYTRSAVYTTNFTVPTSPLTVLTNTEYLTLQDNRRIDNSPNNFTVTYTPLNGTSTLQALSPFGGQTNLPKSYSTYFDGTGDYLTLATNPAFAIGTADFTLECWVMPIGANLPWGTIFAGVNFGSSSDWGLYSGDSTTSLYPTFYFTGSGTPGSGTSQTQGSQTLTAYTQLTIGQWNHIAVSRVSGTARMFINGEQTGPSLNASTWSLTNALQKSIAGGYNGNSNSLFTGNISNLRIISGTGLYTGNFTPSTSPLTAVAGTILLTCQSNTIVDNSANRFAITAFGNSIPKPFNPFGTTNTANVGYSPSVNGGSMYFDTTGDYLTAGTFAPGTGNYTVEAWIYPTAAPASQGIIFATPWGGSNFQLMLNTNKTIQWQAYSQSQVTKPAINLNEWTHIAVVRNGSSAYTYVNGVLLDTSTANTNISGTAYVGARGADALYFIGYISDLKVTIGSALYSSNFYPGLTPAVPANNTSLLLTGTSGGVVDAHSSNNLETVGTLQLASEDPYGGKYYSNYFDGTGDYLTLPSSNQFTFGTGSFTIEAWVNTSSNAASYAQWVFSNISTTSGNTQIGLSLNTSGNLLLQTWNTVILTSSTTVPLGTWTHVSASFDGTTYRLFIDGIIRATGTTLYTLSTDGAGNIGYGGQAGNSLFTGHISNLRVVKGTALYTSAFTPSTTPLTAVSGTSLLTCQSNSFKDNSTNNFTITKNGDTKVRSMNPFQNNTKKSIHFPGAGSVLLSGDNFPSGAGSAFTMEFWILPTTLDNIIFRCNGSASSIGIYTNASGQIILSNTYVADFLTATGGALKLGQWNHVAITRTAANLYTVYLDGVSVGTATYATALGVQPMYIGYSTYSLAYNTFYMKDLRVTKGVARTITVPTTPLKAK